MLLLRAREAGRDFEVNWRYFSLTQVNNKEEGWTVWEAPEGEPVRGRLAFKAAEAARRQDAFDRLHMPLLEARHIHRQDLEDARVGVGAAGQPSDADSGRHVRTRQEANKVPAKLRLPDCPLWP